MQLSRCVSYAVAALLLASSVPPAAAARNIAIADSDISEQDADTLQRGDFLWNPNLAPEGAVSIEVDLDDDLVYVRRNDVLIGISTISSGRRGYATPTGTFQIIQKAKMHRSNKYASARMPYMQRLTWGGVALHAGSVFSKSHGCIHLPRDFARELYQVTNLSTVVEIHRGTVDEG